MKKFVPRQRKHKIQKRGPGGQRSHIEDTNATEILPQRPQDPASLRDAAKRNALKESMRAEQPTASSKKRKRMDKYIDRKIRKDDTADLIRKLERAHAAGSSQAASSGAVGLPKRKKQRRFKSETIDSSSEDSVSDPSSEDPGAPTVLAPISKPPEYDKCQPIFGSGLKTSSDGASVSIPKRKRFTQANSIPPTQEELPWDGFSSEDGEERASETSPESDEETNESEWTSNDSTDDNAETDTGQHDQEGIGASRTSAFKSWVSQQINEAVGFVPSAIDHQNSMQDVVAQFVPRKQEEDPLPAELQVSTDRQDRKAFNVRVERLPEIQAGRMKLPVVAEEQRIMEAIYNNPVVVICGATGSGKTTQIPQFLYEAGFGNPDGPTPGMIGVTQPRRVAAVSMAQRVGAELDVPAPTVAYQVRYDATVKPGTAIKLMTDGILLREMANDFLLSKYSVIVVDEAHERTINTDVLLGMLTRCVTLRNEMAKEDSKNKPLKLIIMSATLRVDDFMENAKLFKEGKPPLLEVEGRQYDVDVHFSRRTQADYLEEVFQKISKGHKKLPSGGMLVFLTGKIEIDALEERLRDSFPVTKSTIAHEVRITSDEAPLESEDFDFTLTGDQDTDENWEMLEEDDVHVYEDTEFTVDGEEALVNAQLHILPLYSMLPTKEQLKIFDAPPEGSRLIVLATNIAETSLTIPGIRYVFDTGRVKEKKYNHLSGVQTFEVGWISKASAEQRKGRAGRTGPGHCYRLYSSAVYERDFEQHAQPEILSVPIEGIVLQLKSMHIPSVLNFPFPTPPERGTLAKAEKLLKYLGAITLRGEVTKLGQQMSHFPLSPRFAKMLSSSSEEKLMPHIIRIVAALATPELFVSEPQALQNDTPDFIDIEAGDRLNQYRRAHHQYCRHSPTSDAIKLMTAIGDGDHCNVLNAKAVQEATQLQAQLAFYVLANSQSRGTLEYFLTPSPPSKPQIKSLQLLIAVAFLDQIAIRYDKHPHAPDLPRKPSRAIDIPYLPLTPLTPTSTDLLDIAIFIHPTSVLARLSASKTPEYIIYSHLQRSTTSTKPRTRMHALTDVNDADIARLARGTTLMEWSKPLKILAEERIGERSSVAVPTLVSSKGSTGWPLPARKVLQKKVGMEWVVDKIWEDGRWV